MTTLDLYAVTERLQRADFWFPPDAIVAVHEGRQHYHALDPKITYDVDRCPSGMVETVRAVVARAIRRVHPYWRDPRGDLL